MSERCACGSRFQLDAGVFWAAYVLGDSEAWCCVDCAEGRGCGCAVLNAAADSGRLKERELHEV